jgi:hypothetical protein
MIKTKLASLGKRLLPEFPDLTIKGRLMFVKPIEQVLRGINFEGSKYNDTSFYVTVFVMPLCVPTDHLYFNFGNRVRHLGGGDRWNLEMPNLIAELGSALKLHAIPFFSTISSLPDFVEYAQSHSKAQRTLEAIGYSLARTGHIGRAIEVFNELFAHIDQNIAWQRDLAKNVNALKTELIDHPVEAQQHLAEYERQTIHTLGLDEFR